MDDSVEINISDVNNETSHMAAASSVLGVIKKIIGVFVLSDKEKMEAGIDPDDYYKRRDASLDSGKSNSSDTVQANGRIG